MGYLHDCKIEKWFWLKLILVIKISLVGLKYRPYSNNVGWFLDIIKIGIDHKNKKSSKDKFIDSKEHLINRGEDKLIDSKEH